MKQYLKANPEYSQYDYPSFEEFDRNGCDSARWLTYGVGGWGRVRRLSDEIRRMLSG